MDLLLHTIALEPARWTARRIAVPLAEWLPRLAQTGFSRLEVFEPHLTLAPDEAALAGRMADHGLVPVILSSYLDLSPAANPEPVFQKQAESLLARVDRFGFRKVRLFPGRADSEDVAATVARVAARVGGLAAARPEVEFLLETHDGSLADDPLCMVRLVEACARPNVGLLWQPTVFAPVAARRQFDVQKALIRHFHLQNRTPDGSYTTLRAGVVPWAELLAESGFALGSTLEFVPSGICPPERFDFEASLQEAVEERAYLRQIAGAHGSRW